MGTATAAMDRNADGEQGKRKKKGGFRTMPLILGEEINRVQYMAASAILHRLMLQLFTPICGVCAS
jgi:hypothetical protein